MARNSGKLGSAVLVAVIICFGFFFLGIVGSFLPDSGSGDSSVNRRSNRASNYRDPRIEAELQAKALADAATEQLIHDWTKTGFIHSVHIQEDYMRVDPIVWRQLPIELKQTAVTAASQYLIIRGQSGCVEIRSSRNDRKLATYSSWDGMKILE
jgi:hypothetical protein